MNNKWSLIKIAKRIPVLKRPMLVEGMPGIGNVGKVAVDFIIEELDAIKLYDFFSHHLPSSVFVNEDNLAELPSISLYCKKQRAGPDVLFLAGDVQPIDEPSTYAFCEAVLDVFVRHGGKELITLGGIGLPAVPKSPKLYCTANTAQAMKAFAGYTGVHTKLYGVVGPVMGVSGVLLGLAAHRRIPAASLLAETYNHPMFLGIKGAREIVRVLNAHLRLGIDLHEMDSEINKIEMEISKRTKALEAGKSRDSPQDASYIG